MRVLHLEDSLVDAELVKTELQAEGVECNISLVNNEEQFRAALHHEAFDLILADHALAMFSGDSALEIHQTVCPDIPFIFVTGYLGEDLAIETLKRGATDFVLKNNLSRLAPAVRRALREVKMRREQKAAEEARSRSEERFKIVARVTNDALWEWDLSTDELHWGEGIHKLLGVLPEEVEPNVGWWHDRIHPEDRGRIQAELIEALKTGSKFWSTEYGYRRADGTYARASSRAQIIYDESGHGVRVIGALVDMTARLRLEEQLRQAQKMEAVGRLAGGIAHDFNNLLTIISGYTELVLQSSNTASATHRLHLTHVKRAAERASGLTRQLLAFSRQQVLKPQVIDLNEIVLGISPMLRPLIGEDVRLQTALFPVSLPVKADPGQIEQVILNLAANARDAMPTGGELIVKTLKRQFAAHPSVPGNEVLRSTYAALEVSDTGTGIDPETKNHIFEPFFTTKVKGKGTGLGLPSVYGIVNQSGGFIEVNSEPGEGTQVTVCLPLVEQALPVSGERQVNGFEFSGPETILVVEDDDMVRTLTCEVLQKHGYRLLQEPGGAEAITALQESRGPVDLLLTDVVMPGISGPELAERARALRPGLRVLFISGYAGDGVQQISSRGEHFLQKPYSLEALMRKIREVLEGEH